jgi:hypothetical protein
MDVDLPRLSAWSVFGPLFEGASFDTAALPAAQAPEDMLEIQVNYAERRRHDDQGTPASLDECGRCVTLAEAEEMITILARADRVAVDELGAFEIRTWTT